MPSAIIPNDENIKDVTFYKYKSPLFYGYVGPFLLIYLIYTAIWAMKFGIKQHLELGLILYGFLVVLNIITFLACIWSVNVRSKLLCLKVDHISNAQYVKVLSNANIPNTMVKFYQNQDEKWFDFYRIKYLFNSDKKYFEPLNYPDKLPYSSYLNHKGISDEQFKHLETLYGPNRLNIEIPEFMDLMKQRATSPFFVFQVICVALWSLYDQFYYSCFTLAMLIIFEATLVKQQLRNMAEIRKMGNQAYPIQVYRNRRWKAISSDTLLPGDICSITRNNTVPCDCVLLKGTCIVDESMLTGESVPQPKESIESESPDTLLDETTEEGKLRVLFGGTQVVQTLNSPSKLETTPIIPGIKDDDRTLIMGPCTLKSPDNGCICYVTKTAFSTSQGKLLRTILISTQNTASNNAGGGGGSFDVETLCFILMLLVFAISASIYVWIYGTLDPSRSRYKLLLECILIITSVVPPELPIELSLAINSSLIALSKLGIYCTEPFRIPFAGKLNVLAFDKTGTLTTDHFNIDGVLEPDDLKSIKPLCESHLTCQIILGCCHSLMNMNNNNINIVQHSTTMLTKKEQKVDSLIGDPLEKAIVQSLGWILTKNDVMIPTLATKQLFNNNNAKSFQDSNGNNLKPNLTCNPIKILHKFHFQSTLKRMSVICEQSNANNFGLISNNASTRFGLVKGAPETLKSMFKDIPSNYDETYLKLARDGCRILALGIKGLDDIIDAHKNKPLSDLRDLVESDLLFQGFLIVSCPLKPDSYAVIQELLESQHKIIMITGDNHLTACHVGRELGLFESPSRIFHLNTDIHPNIDGYLQWESFDRKGQIKHVEKINAKLAFSSINTKKFDICLTGTTYEYLIQLMREGLIKQTHFIHIINQAVICARFTPKQKENIIHWLNTGGGNVSNTKQGYQFTLMCGDGTNDVGALKASHIGVSILSNGPSKYTPPKLMTSKKFDNTHANNDFVDKSPKNISKGQPLTKKELFERKMAKINNLEHSSKAKTHASNNAKHVQTLENTKKRIENLMEQLEKEGGSLEPALVKLGDASIAAPFTSKTSSIQCVCDIIKQGRCTLVTTLQMYVILALNALILAYSQSVLYLDGVKYSDTQSTCQGLLLAICFLAISRSKPLKHLSVQKPLSNIFNVATLSTIFGQFAIHFATLVYLYREAIYLSPPKEEGFVNLEADFKPNLVNSTVYIVSLTLQVATFLINYRGKPFMESLKDNKALFFSIMVPLICAFALALNTFPNFTQYLEVVPLPNEFKWLVVKVLIGDLISAYILNTAIHKFFG